MIAPSIIVPNNNEEEQHNNEPMIHNEPIVEEPQEVTLRRSQRERRSAISNDYMVYLHETETDLSINDNDQILFSQVVSYDNLDAMKEELNSMEHNSVRDLVHFPKGCKKVGCKWVFKTKHDSHGNLERYKARLVAKRFTQKDEIVYKETFSPISRKNSFKIIMTLKYFVVKVEVQKQKVSIEHISKNLMIVNPLTKGDIYRAC